jgi:nicotinamidase-related amidase
VAGINIVHVPFKGIGQAMPEIVAGRIQLAMGTPLELLLRQMGKDTLLIAGCNTNTCVLSSAFGAYNRGLCVVVIEDCVASAYGDDLHAFALANIQRRLGWVLTLRELDAKLA